MNASATNTPGMNARGKWVPLMAGIVSLLVVCIQSKAQSPRTGGATRAQGRIQSFTTAPRGEVDGAVLDDGTIIHWPPHLAARFTTIVALGDRIQVTGRMETGPAGDTHLEAHTVTNLRTNASAENDFAPPPPPAGPRAGRARPGPRSGETKAAEGRVQSLTTAPKGEVDGAVLEDGTVIHWPPHLATRFAAVVARGDRVQVNGWTKTGPAGDTRLEVQDATNLRTNAFASRDAAGPPPASAGVDGSEDFVASPERRGDLERRVKELQDQISELRDEVRRFRSAP